MIPRDSGRLDFSTEKVRDMAEFANKAKPYTNFKNKNKKTSAESHLVYDLSRIAGCGNRADIGVLYGRSTIEMAHGIQDSGLNGTIFAVDLFGEHGVDLHLIPGQLKSYIEKENLSNVDLIICKGDSVDWGRMIKETFRFVFIDGGHEYPQVKADFNIWSVKVEPSGYLAFHDCDYDSVDRCIREIDQRDFKFVRQVYSTKVFQRI